MTELDIIAGEVHASGRTLRRALERGTVRGSRPSPHRVAVPVVERVWIRRHWALVRALMGVLRTEPSVRLAVLFGSFARGDERADSDVDLLIMLRGDSYLIRAALRDG